MCSDADCVCGYNAGGVGSCDGNTPDGLSDNPDCADAAESCFAGACLLINDEICGGHGECGSGQCECTRTTHKHAGRCTVPLGNKWEAHHITAESSGGGDGLSNCEALCEPCHEQTATYGRS